MREVGNKSQSPHARNESWHLSRVLRPIKFIFQIENWNAAGLCLTLVTHDLIQAVLSLLGNVNRLRAK